MFSSVSWSAAKWGVRSLCSCWPPPVLSPHVPYKGISFSEAMDIRKKHVAGCLKLLYRTPLLITQGHMQWLWDHLGNRYLDMFGGIVTVSVGHCHPKVQKAAVDQLKRLWHVTNIYLHPSLHEYSKKLADRMPGELKVCYFCNSGSEANDLAITLARLHTKAFDIISLKNAYHGGSPSSVGLCGIGSWKHSHPSGFGIHHAMNPDPYKGIWGGAFCRDSVVQTDRTCSCEAGACRAAEEYAGQLELLMDCLPKQIAGFFTESIQGVGGVVQYPRGYLKKAYELVRNRGGLCIADEVQTGFGRTGQFWGFQNHDVLPDIVTLAKGMGNGFPVAAVVTTHEVARHLEQALLFNTFGGNPVACAVGSAVLDVIDEEKLLENCQSVGTHLLHLLSPLRERYEIVGDVRGKGLMIGVELVLEKETKTPLPKAAVDEIFETTKHMGLLIGRGGSCGNVFRIKPPMCISKDDAQFCANVLERAISDHVEKH